MSSPNGSHDHSPRRRAGGSPRDDDSEGVPKRNTSKERTPSKDRAASKESATHGSIPEGGPPRGNPNLFEEEQDDNNSLDSEVDRRREAEEHASERKEKWRRRRDMVRAICRYIVHLACSKRRLRRERFKHNIWVNVGDRIERQMELKSKRQATFDRDTAMGKEGSKGRKKASRLKRCCSALALMFKVCFQDGSVFLKENLGWVDKRTGLPKAVLENWTFRQRLHENKHGIVFEAVDSEGRLVAVKIRDKSRGNVLLLPFRQAVHTLWKVGAIQRTGKLHALLVRLHLVSPFEHPHLVTLYAVFDNPEFYVEICELMLGPCLATHLEDMDTQLDEIQTCQIFTQIVIALLFLHSRKVLFRDLRLCQIFLTKPLQTEHTESADAEKTAHTETAPAEIQCKLTDYWCCARMKKKHSSMFQPFYPGDIATMSPEVLQYGEWSEKADVWAAGCLLFELLFGHPPYGGEGHALALRIVKQEPEYDLVCGRLSESSLTLLKVMLSRRHHTRPTMSQVLAYPWFHEFGHKDKGRPDGQTAHKIRKIRVEKTPLHRRGMPPENLLVAQTGMFNAGFCSFMGATSCHIDFEIGGPENWRLFWVTSIRVGLWGNGDNPRKVIFSMALREGGSYSELHRANVAGLTSTEVEHAPNRPIRHLRLHFRDNFQGDFGIAIRKVGLLGFEVRPLPVIIDLDTAIYQNSELWMHNEEITEEEINHGRVHRSLRSALEKGVRIAGTAARYWKYRDVYSGAECGTTILGIFLQPEPGYTLVAADLGLRYVAHSPPNATPPRLRITVETPQGKENLFKTADLPDSAWGLRDILTNGYEELAQLHIEHLDISTDETLMVEIHFDLNSGYLNIPSDFGLTFYYMPNLPTPDSEEEFEEIDKDQLVARRGSSSADPVGGDRRGEKAQDVGAGALEDIATGVTGVVKGEKLLVLDDDELEYEAEQSEAVLRQDLKHLQNLTTFGPWGAGNFDKHECPPLEVWNCPEDVEEGATDLLNKRQWWEGAWTDDGNASSSSGFRSQEGTPRLKEVEPGLYVASDTTCAATLATPLRTYSGIERSGSRSHEERHRQSDTAFSSPRETKLDAWGAIDEWEKTPEWMRLEHGGRTDAWGVPLDDRAAQEVERADRERSTTRKLAENTLAQLRQKTRAPADMTVAKLHSVPVGRRFSAMGNLAEQKMHEVESSFASVCKRLCPDSPD